MNRNVFLFLETYEFGKKIEALREYLGHVSLMVEIDYESLSNVKKKIEALPDKFYDEKRELLMKLKIILDKNKNSALKNQRSQKKDSLKFVVGNDSEDISLSSSKRQVEPKLNLKKINLNNFKNDLNLFEKTQDKGEILNLYKRIMTDIKKLSITQDKKREMMLVLNKELHKKRLS